MDEFIQDVKAVQMQYEEGLICKNEILGGIVMALNSLAARLEKED